MVDWVVHQGPTDYAAADAAMHEYVDKLIAREVPEAVWLHEFNPVITGGITAKNSDVLRRGIPYVRTNRYGELGYHGPGQRTMVVMLDLRDRGYGAVEYGERILRWMRATAAAFGVETMVDEGKFGVWVDRPDGSGRDKLCSYGYRAGLVSWHGCSINVDPNLSHYDNFRLCGITGPETGITSLRALGVDATMDQVDEVLKQKFAGEFGPL